jgi:predicted nucleic acid-binding protein
MIHGLDTGFLVAAEIVEHHLHLAARQTLSRVVASSDLVAIAPQVLAEFIHVATDPRRFQTPLDITTAVIVAEQWWTAKEVVQVFPDRLSVTEFFNWLKTHGLGRKRLLDTFFAATYHTSSINSLLTTNQADFQVFGVFTCLVPAVAP